MIVGRLLEVAVTDAGVPYVGRRVYRKRLAELGGLLCARKGQVVLRGQ